MRFTKGSGGGDYEKPTADIHLARLCAIYDCGVRQAPGSKFGPKHTIVLCWTLGSKDSEGKAFIVYDPVTMSLMDGAHLAARIEAINKRGLTEAERDDFEPRTILGTYAKLWLKETGNGKIVVKQAQPVEEGHALIAPGEDYTKDVPRYVTKVVEEEAATMDRFLKDINAGEAAGPDAIAMAIPPEASGVNPGRAPATPEAAPPPAAALPEGWTAHTDPNTGKTYYAGPGGVTQWEAPAPAPAPEAAPPPAAPGAPGTDAPY